MGLRDKAQIIREGREGELSTSSVPKHACYFLLDLFHDDQLKPPIEAFVSLLKTQFNTEKIALHFLDENENWFKLIGDEGLSIVDSQSFSIEYDSYFIKAIFEPRKIKDLIAEPKHKKEMEQFLEQKLVMITPMMIDEEIKGFISLGAKNDGSEYKAEDYAELDSISRKIGSALNNFHSIQMKFEKVNELTKNQNVYLTILESSRNINLAENLEEALTIFYKTMQDFFHIKAANILIAKSSGKKFKTLKSLGFSKQTDSKFIIELKEEIFSNLIEIGESMFIPEYESLKVYQNGIADEDKEKVKFFYCVPIKLGERCVGFFNVFNGGDDKEGHLSNDFEKALAFIPLGLLPYIINESK